MDKVVVRNLRASTRIGLTEEERAEPQVVLVSLEVTKDLTAPSLSDNIDETLDYGLLVPQVAALIERSETKLLEKLAGDIAVLVEGFSGVSGVAVEIAKASPPLAEQVEQVAVRIERRSA